MKPEVWVSRCLIVIGPFAATSVGFLSVPPVQTRIFASAGRYFPTGSSSRIRPSSTSVIAAAVVMIFDIE